MNVQRKRLARNRTIGREVLVTKREMLMAQLLLRVCDTIAHDDRDLEFIRLVDEIKPIAEGIMRNAS